MAVKLKNTDFKSKFDEYALIALQGGFLYDSENKDAVNACIDVLKENKTGLMIIGNPGSGKTLFFEIAQRIIAPNSENLFLKLNVLDVVLQFNNKEIGHLIFRKWQDKNVFFDDLGTETKGFLYGEKIEVFEKLIQFRYDLFRSKKIKTHFTTNLSYYELKERYGTRCVSRLGEMCEIVLLGEKANAIDRRRLKNFVSLPFVSFAIEKSQEQIDIEKRYKIMKENAKNNPIQKSEGMGQRFKKQFGF